MFMIDSEIVIKLAISAALGLIIGLERELKRKPVGLKTCLVISIVSCVLTIVSVEAAYSVPARPDINITMDPLRLAAQIISGIGFLGAGVILRRGNDSISGLTTAALIWGAAGIGVAVGAGFYFAAAVGVLLLIISVEIIPFIIQMFGPKKLRQQDFKLQISIKDKKKIVHIIDILEQEKISINHLRIKDVQHGEHLVQLKISANQKRTTTDIYYFVSQIDGVENVEIETLQ